MSNELQQEYLMRFEANAPYRIATWDILISDFFARWIAPQSALLDLGCGWGEFVNQIGPAVKYGMDLNPDSPAKLSPGITFFSQDCSLIWPLDDGKLDVVFTSNFFEHLPSKESLRRTLDQAFRCLKSNGRLICLGPNIRFLPGSYWDFWDHYLPLTDESLAEGLRLAGFGIEHKVSKFLPYSMSRGFAPPLILLRIYLRFPLLWHFFGKQFLVIARKP